MKKYIYHILAAFSAVLLLGACHQEEEVVEKTSLKVVSSDVIIGVEGGTGTIVVEADQAVTATADRPWCQVSVSGNAITVTVSEPNLNPSSRYSRLTIKAGTEETGVTVHQYGEIFDGMDLSDVDVPREGATFRYSYKANMTVQMNSDQPWIHFEQDEEEEEAGLIRVVVDENTDFGTRFATVSFTAGTNTGSMKVTQAPKVGKITGWTVANPGGRFEFPDQIDEITVTPSADMMAATNLYAFKVVPKDDLQEKGMENYAVSFAEEVRTDVLAKVKTGFYEKFADGVLSGFTTRNYYNLAATVWGIVVCFDVDGYPTGQYYYQEVSIPDRGPVKQLVDGWDIAHTDATYVHPVQTDVFTVTPKAGYETVPYIVLSGKKESISDVMDFAFTKAMEVRSEILAKVAAGELPSFEAGLCKGTTTHSYEGLVGDVYLAVVAFDDNQFYTGDSTFAEFAVEDKMPAYYKWPGKWKVSSGSFSEVWEITIDENNLEKSFFIDGINSITTASIVNNDADLMVLTYNADGTVSLKSQKGKEFHYSDSYGTCTMQVQGRITTNGGSSYSRITTMGLNLFTCALSEDGMTATMTPASVKVTAGTFEFVQFRLWLVRNDTGGTYSLNASSGVIPIPLVMERVE